VCQRNPLDLLKPNSRTEYFVSLINTDEVNELLNAILSEAPDKNNVIEQFKQDIVRPLKESNITNILKETMIMNINKYTFLENDDCFVYFSNEVYTVNIDSKIPKEKDILDKIKKSTIDPSFTNQSEEINYFICTTYAQDNNPYIFYIYCNENGFTTKEFIESSLTLYPNLTDDMKNNFFNQISEPIKCKLSYDITDID
jgi:hypothetical protein